MAVDCDNVFAGFEEFGIEDEVFVLACPSASFESEFAVDVDRDIVIVVEPELSGLVDTFEIEFAANPDVVSFPFRVDDGTGGAFGAESRFSGFPRGGVEVGFFPV